MSAFSPQGLANTAWSVAVLEFQDHPLRASTAAAALRPLSEFLPQHLSNTAWAL
eukprot:CAMPEP_0179341124 /NCGR_PEP_ID=MMETSP0797-20121207/69668_1 /TAXON_ID=47934 /ORGANISM="Dinophysis acuminata, Strain DAEP01" /LENGTH=53 /DNA_ID=CAMNT_0021055175 /DNA_START=243 /DNA_END=401 /DNA_ORIENTATION=-